MHGRRRVVQGLRVDCVGGMSEAGRFFGLSQFWQVETPVEIAGVAAITGLGGLLFGWLYARWGFNIWPPILELARLNGVWTFFALGKNALGGEIGNIVRFGTVALTLHVTLAMRRAAVEPQPGSP